MRAERGRARFRALSVLLATALLSAGTGAGAAIPRKPTQVAPTRPADATLAQALDRAKVQDCKGVLALLDPLVAGAAPLAMGGSRFSAQLLRLPCLAPQGRAAEIGPVLAELRAVAPQHPLVLGFEIFTDVDAGRIPQAADRLATLANTGSRALQLVPGALWRVVAQRLTESGEIARRDATALALARAGWTPLDLPDLGQGVALDAIGALLAQGEAEEARALLPRIVWPGSLWDMAIQRRYQPLWPQIEARLGPQSGAAADRYARGALNAFANGPENGTARRDAVRAFIVLGRASDVDSLAAPVPVKPGMSEDEVEIVLRHAQALTAGGDRAAAIARLRPFATLDFATAPAAASALIALAETLAEAGQDAEALAVARQAMQGPGRFFSPFGTAWLRRSEVCGLVATGADSAAAVTALTAHAADNQAAAVEGLLCAGRDDQAATIAIAALATPEGTSRLADQFQPADAMFLPTHSKLRALWERLLRRPDVRRAFDASARLLPQPLRPAGTPRTIPVLQDPSTGTVSTT